MHISVIDCRQTDSWKIYSSCFVHLHLYVSLLPSISCSFVWPPPCCLWQGPSQSGMVPAARFPSPHLSPSLAQIFCIVEAPLRKTCPNSTQRCSLTRPHTHTHCSFRHTITTWTKCCSARNRQVDISFLSFYLFISICPSIPWLFVSWAEISLLNNLVLLKRDHLRGTEGGEKETE